MPVVPVPPSGTVGVREVADHVLADTDRLEPGPTRFFVSDTDRDGKVKDRSPGFVQGRFSDGWWKRVTGVKVEYLEGLEEDPHEKSVEVELRDVSGTLLATACCLPNGTNTWGQQHKGEKHAAGVAPLDFVPRVVAGQVVIADHFEIEPLEAVFLTVKAPPRLHEKRALVKVSLLGPAFQPIVV